MNVSVHCFISVFCFTLSSYLFDFSALPSLNISLSLSDPTSVYFYTCLFHPFLSFTDVYASLSHTFHIFSCRACHSSTFPWLLSFQTLRVPPFPKLPSLVPSTYTHFLPFLHTPYFPSSSATQVFPLPLFLPILCLPSRSPNLPEGNSPWFWRGMRGLRWSVIQAVKS